MKKIFFILMILVSKPIYPQQSPVDEEDFASAQLEDLSQEEETESENDYDMQQLDHYRKNPLNVNTGEIAELPLLDPLLIENLKSYRRMLGDIIDIHELQAVPGFTSEIIKRIVPFVTVKKRETSASNLKQRIRKGNHSMLMRFSIIPEKAEGFKETSGSSQKFEGSRPAMFMRYKYQYRNLLQFGYVSDKDPGELMFVKKPFMDFVSFHLFARHVGSWKAIAFGDYTINLGQGLIHWQNQAYKKSSTVLNIKRQGEVLRPYQSAGEYNFHRGLAATFEKRKWQATLFISSRKISANIDEGTSGEQVITSVQTSGLHRTASENSDRHVVKAFVGGANVKRLFRNGHFGINAVGVTYNLPIEKTQAPYNYYALAGKAFLNASADYNYTYRNFHLFGEAAVNRQLSRGAVAGVISSLSGSVDIALLYRDINKAFTSVYGNAFTESTTPSNERGIYTGISLKPRKEWRIDVYGDVFSFPWLKYRLDAPSNGFAYLVQVTFKPNKQTEIYSRYRHRIKPLNLEYEEEEFPGHQVFSNWRSQVSFQLTPQLLLKSRVEVCIYDHRFLETRASGYLFFTEVHFKPRSFWLSGNARLQTFEADNYETRIYAYENDLLFVSSTPSYYNNGIRYYVNLKGKFRVKRLSNKSLTLSLKASSTVYTNISTIGTGLAEISGPRNSALKLQFFLTE